MTLIEAFTSHARAAPQAGALQWNQAYWTYAELERAHVAVREGLRALGVRKGERVALLLRNSPQYVAALYGTLAAGGAAVALNVLERAEVLLRQIAHSGAVVVIIDKGHAEFARLRDALADGTVRVVAVSTPDASSALADLLAEWPALPEQGAADLASADLALLIYTSGTTGRPKAVMLSHGNLASNARAIAQYLEVTPQDRAFNVLPFHFSFGNSVLTSHLSSGALLILEDNLAFLQRSLQRMATTRATSFAGVPSTFTLLLTRCRLRDFDLSTLRYVTQAGGAMTRQNITRLREELPGVRVFVMYGQTEATARISYLPPELLGDNLGSVGRPIADTTIEICDQQGTLVPQGATGEVRVRGPGVMLGYWRDDQASSEVVRDGWLYTGDLGHLDAGGLLYIDGRAVEMIKVGAFRVSPYEVEEAIAQLHDVQEVAVGATPDEVLGQAVKAVIVLREGASLDELAVKAHCRQSLATYKIPKIVEFAAQLPRTMTGKVQRLQLS